ncbi:hypothetical protein ACFE04_015576 [Oxalis oulophora]
MVQGLRSVCRIETRLLSWLIGMTLLVIVSFQYFEFPYESFNSLLSAGKVSVEDENRSSNVSSTPNSVDASQTNSSSSAVNDKELSSADGNFTITSGDKVNSTFTLPDIGNSTEHNENSNMDSGTERSSEKNGTMDDNFSLGSEDDDEANQTLSLGNTGNDASLNQTSLSPVESSNGESDKQTNNSTVHNDDSSGNGDGKESFTQENAKSPSADFPPPFPAPPTIDSSVEKTKNVDLSRISPQISVAPNITSPTSFISNQSEVDKLHDSVPEVRRKPVMPTQGVYSIADMNRLLIQNRAMHQSEKPRWSSVADEELLNAKSQIENAPIVENDPELYAPLYHNVSMFKRSYELMEKLLKVYIYKEGDRPIFHTPVLKGIYASEGWFMKLLQSSKTFLTKDGKKAHLFYLPFSSRILEEQLYVVDSHSHQNLIQHLKDYLGIIGGKHPFWNRTDGADHFLVACHDWAPSETRKIMAKCIRALCNSDVKEGYIFGKDVSLPETMVHNAENPLQFLGGNPISSRTTLAFFAGQMHGYLRPILIEHWGGEKDPDMRISDQLPKPKKGRKTNMYIQSMKTSKYCICPRGYEVNSPRIVEAIFFECVPVIISDNFVPPFFEILNWESFAVFVKEKDVPNLKKILLSIPEKRYLQMRMRVKKIQKHFLWHKKPVKYDIFHMILHSIWYKRVFQM